MRVALIHYWLVTMRGGEKVLEALCELFPQADIFTHVYVPEAVSPTIRSHTVHTSFIQKLPFAERHYQKYLPLMPLALEQLDLRGYDLVISTESGPAKGVLVDSSVPHICYCFTPMRYLWDHYQQYLEECGAVTRFFWRPLAHYLRMWDTLSASRVDHFIADSQYVARRIARHYRREAVVIPPPVDVQAYAPAGHPHPPGDAYLFLGQLVGYKRADIAVEACSRTGRQLIVAGDGPQLEALRAMAGPGVRFVGRLEQDALRPLLQQCRALIFPADEDFGIVPVEAMAAGRPVIAYGRGEPWKPSGTASQACSFPDRTPGALWKPWSVSRQWKTLSSPRISPATHIHSPRNISGGPSSDTLRPWVLRCRLYMFICYCIMMFPGPFMGKSLP